MVSFVTERGHYTASRPIGARVADNVEQGRQEVNGTSERIHIPDLALFWCLGEKRNTNHCFLHELQNCMLSSKPPMASIIGRKKAKSGLKTKLA